MGIDIAEKLVPQGDLPECALERVRRLTQESDKPSYCMLIRFDF